MIKLKKNNFNGELGEFIIYDTAGKLNFSSVMLLGFGSRRSLNKGYIYRSASIASKNLKKFGKRVVLDYNLSRKKGYLSAFLEGFIQGSYEFNKYKTKNNKNFAYKSLEIFIKNSKSVSIKNDIDYAVELSAAVSLCRDLVNEPPVFLTPTKLAEISTKISEEGKLDIKVSGF